MDRFERILHHVLNVIIVGMLLVMVYFNVRIVQMTLQLTS